MFEGLMTLATASTLLFGALSSSSSYQLQNYGLGSGGTSSSASPSYKLNASSGELGGTPSAGGTTKAGSGTTETRQANVPLAPTLSNGSGAYYNKLLATINKSASDASDYTYSIAVSTNNFTTTNYVQADGTVSGTAVYQTYAAWGGASGSFIIGLSPNTTYQVKMNATQASFSASAYGPSASATTANPSISFTMTPNNVSLGTFTPGVTSFGSSNIDITFATNAAAGGSVYIAGLNSGLRSASNNYTIPAVTVGLGTVSEGYGIQGLSVGQTSGGPFTIISPYNGSTNVVGDPTPTFKQMFASTAAIVGGTASAQVKAKASAVTPSGSDYGDTLTFIASASF